jgi:hypothetical protein
VCIAILTTAAIASTCKDLFLLSSPKKEDTVVTEFLMNGLLPQNYKSFVLGMRKNMTNYVAFLNRFAPRVVTSRRWNNSTLVEDACKGGPGAFDTLLSVSDEAFMLVVMENYVESWHAAVWAKETDAPHDDKETEEDEEEGTTPVSLCVPWQMSMKQVANINTVLTYI